MSDGRTAWVAGASGLVGKELLRLLIADPAYARVVSLGRRTLGETSGKVLEAKVDFAALDTRDLPKPDVAFCSLGTTIKKAGSREAFRAVDHDAVLAFAKAARAAGAKTLVHVSAIGADKPRSFYATVKNEIERDLDALDFETVVALRPSILDGDREESRPLESVGLAVMRAFGPVLGRYKPTAAAAVARAMVAKARDGHGREHVEADAIV